MKSPTVQDFKMHGISGVAVKQKDFLSWLKTHDPSELGSKIVSYSWQVDKQTITRPIDISKVDWRELPDGAGFICFDNKRNIDNCTILDVFGEERFRLSVPVELTAQTIPSDSERWFRNISSPYINPTTGNRGHFGVTAWIEYVGDYYFELDYKTGKFLWGKPIRF